MNRSCGIILLGLILAPASLAQISVSQNSAESMFGLGKRIELYVDTTSDRPKADVGQKGGPHTYDFSDIKLDLFHADTLKSVSQFPELASRFPGTGIVFTFPNDFGGFDLEAIEFTGGMMTTVGSYDQIDTTEISVQHFSPSDPWFIFPVAYGDSLRIDYEHRDSTFKDGALTNVFVHQNPMDHVVDGYGTLVLPNGESYQCIRLRKSEFAPQHHRGFWFLTNDGVYLIVDSENDQPEEDSVLNNGVFVLRGDAPTSVEKFNDSPKGFSLQQNYPNPFNPATQISFTMGSEEHVTLRVFDVLGRKVETILDATRPAGVHSVRWNATGLVSGVYVLRIDAGSYHETRRMMLVR